MREKVMSRFQLAPGLIAFLSLTLGGTAASGEDPPVRTQGSPDLTSARPYLRWDRQTYRNYALEHFSYPPYHSWSGRRPFIEAPQAYYGPMGDYLITGYDLYNWHERRQPGQEYGSSIFKDNEVEEGGGSWIQSFDSLVMARDGYGGWGYSLVVGDGLLAHFTPLTLSKVNFNGARFDLALPRLSFTGMASRIERPHAYQEVAAIWNIEKTHYAEDSILLLGGRTEADLGRLRLGLNWANMHLYNSIREGNSLRGVLRPDQPLMDYILVRFSDDSPADGVGGAVVQEVSLVINGEVRTDIRPRVVRHWQGITPQVGSVSQATGSFRPTNYTSPRTRIPNTAVFRGREIPLYADYLYRLDHEAGIDVGGATNLEGLVGNIHVESPGEVLRADGEEQLVFVFDLSQEPRVESVQLEAFLGNDFLVEVALLSNQNPRGKTYNAQYLATYFQTVRRAAGNVHDLSNFRRRRIDVGENTGIFTYSADVKLSLPGLEVSGEYARSALYSRYPGHQVGAPLFDESPASAQRGSAYFLNATRWFERGRAGAEYFAINPGFQTEMRTYIHWEDALFHSNIMGITNSTLYWELVEDNDDGDRFPDRRIGNLVGYGNDSQGYDLDGVFLGQDEDNDGWPETNRDGDLIPDSDEPFLMYDVEPNAYAYGLDRNHNDEPDPREDDGEVDYPYDHDQRGYHLFGQLDLSRHWSLSLGGFASAQIAGGGRNRSAYALLTYRRKGIGRLRQVFFENSLRRVQDDIADEYVATDDRGDRTRNFSFRGLGRGNVIDAFIHDYPPVFSSRFVPDLLFYQDSYVNESYLEARLRPLPALDLVQKLRLRFNWQQGGRLHNGLFQKERRLDFFTLVSRAGYTLRWGRLKVTPQYKLMLLRLMDRERGRAVRDELRSIPILRLEYPLLLRTTLRAGAQGWGPMPYRRHDRVAGRFSFEQRTAFLTLTNSSRYFGYELYTIVGLNKDGKEYDLAFQNFQGFDGWSFFVRCLVGFTEFGRPI